MHQHPANFAPPAPLPVQVVAPGHAQHAYFDVLCAQAVPVSAPPVYAGGAPTDGTSTQTVLPAGVDDVMFRRSQASLCTPGAVAECFPGR